ncbi:hypothetical protein MNBD_GAMMA01-169 [hydrothermal vent metagenome]|uniref:DUF3301 domain-containing protein n=1 Tax=hydrothermal vent metagenome TaxID=652676 RepID=A0A3B0VRZ3_9ZZZZ
MLEITLLLVMGLFILLIATNAKARDIARAYSKRETLRRQCVFLDDSIALKSMKIKKIKNRFGLYRSYAFEYNEADFQRYDGKIELLGYHVIKIQYFQPDHIEHESGS